MSIIWDKPVFWQVALIERIHCVFFCFGIIRNKTRYSNIILGNTKKLIAYVSAKYGNLAPRYTKYLKLNV